VVSSVAEAVVLYASPENDITDQVITDLNVGHTRSTASDSTTPDEKKKKGK